MPRMLALLAVLAFLAAPGMLIAWIVGQGLVVPLFKRASTSFRLLGWSVACMACGICGWYFYELGRIPIGSLPGGGGNIFSVVGLAAWYVVSSLLIPLTVFAVLTSSEGMSADRLSILRLTALASCLFVGFSGAQARDRAARRAMTAGIGAMPRNGEVVANPVDTQSLHWLTYGIQPTFEDGRLVALAFPRDTQADLGLVRDAHTLKSLHLMRSGLIEEQLEFLSPLLQLEELYLTDCNLTDAATVYLSRLPNLRKLVLDGNPDVSDASLEPIYKVVSLRELSIYQTSVTSRGATALQIANSDLRIFGVVPIVDGPSRRWSKRSWEEVHNVLGEKAFQDALRRAGIEGIPADAPAEESDEEKSVRESIDAHAAEAP